MKRTVVIVAFVAVSALSGIVGFVVGVRREEARQLSWRIHDMKYTREIIDRFQGHGPVESIESKSSTSNSANAIINALEEIFQYQVYFTGKDILNCSDKVLREEGLALLAEIKRNRTRYVFGRYKSKVGAGVNGLLDELPESHTPATNSNAPAAPPAAK